jgi:hypothetical protein
MSHIVSTTNKLRIELQDAAQERELVLDEVSEKFSSQLASIFEELSTIPSPESAPSHEERLLLVSDVLKKVESGLVHVCGLYGVSEDVARGHFRDIEPHVKHILVTTGE